MTVSNAIAILKEYIEIDREVRGPDYNSNDFDRCCEEKCVAIETVLAELEASTSTWVEKKEA